MIRIYSEHITNRLRYIVNHLFAMVLNTDYQFVESIDDAHIIYGTQRKGNAFLIIPNGLLSETDVRDFKITDIDFWQDQPIFFTQKEGDLPFDIFAASFYLVSRYEEYLPSEKDVHGRYKSDNSLAYKNGFLTKPMVDIWANMLLEKLRTRFSDITPIPPCYRFLSTIDVDNVYLYRHAGLFQNIWKLLKSIRNKNLFLNQLTVIFHLKEDPYFTFPKIEKWHQQLGLKTHYFLHVGPWGKIDRRCFCVKNNIRRILKVIGISSDVGIHISHRGAFDTVQQAKEKRILEAITQQTITQNRFHYLRFRLPDSYQNLLKLGIKEDYSMGYADRLGFRASTSFPFYFYDLKKDQSTELLVHSLPIMDVVLRKRLQLNQQEAIDEVKKIVQHIRQINGECVILWHNQNLSYIENWEDWEIVYKAILKIAK